MDVTRRNFRLVADDFKLLLPSCRFISIDEETSGIKWSKETEFSSADTVQQRYLKMRVISTQYKIIQIGVCLFHDNPAEPGAYIARPYNFYVFPGEGVSDHMAQISMEESSVSFNKRHGLDFNKWIYDGIPYVDAAGEKRLEAKLLPFGDEKDQKESKGDKLPVVLSRPEDKEFVTKALAGVGRWFTESPHETEYLLPDCLPKIRRALFDEVERLYPSLVVENRATDDPWRFVGVVMRLTPEEKAARPNREQSERKREFEEKIGFRSIFRQLVDAKKPLIGHNIVYDLLFMMSHFDGQLASDEESFRERLHSYFPLVFDTKYIIQTEAFLKIAEPRLTLASTSLVDVYSAIKSKVDKSDIIPVTLSRGFEAYRDESQVFHEAAFDAYAAGVVFVNTIHGNEQPFLPSPSKQLFGDFSPEELKKLGAFCGAGWEQFDDDEDDASSGSDDEGKAASPKAIGFNVAWGKASSDPTIDAAAQLIADEMNSKASAASTPDPFAAEHKRGASTRGTPVVSTTPRIQPNAPSQPTIRRVERIERRPRVVVEGEWEVVTSLGVGPYPLIDEVTGEEIWLKLTLDVRRGDDVVEYDDVTVVDEIVDGVVPPISTGGNGVLAGAPSMPGSASGATPLSPRSADIWKAARRANASTAAAAILGVTAGSGTASGATTNGANTNGATTNGANTNGANSRRGSATERKSSNVDIIPPNGISLVTGESNGGSISRRGSQTNDGTNGDSTSRRGSASQNGNGNMSAPVSAGPTPRGSVVHSSDPATRAIEEQLRAASSVRTLTAQGADGFRSSIIDVGSGNGSSLVSGPGMSLHAVAETDETTPGHSTRVSISGLPVGAIGVPVNGSNGNGTSSHSSSGDGSPSFPPPTFKSTFPDSQTPRSVVTAGISIAPPPGVSHSRQSSAATSAGTVNGTPKGTPKTATTSISAAQLSHSRAASGVSSPAVTVAAMAPVPVVDSSDDDNDMFQNDGDLGSETDTDDEGQAPGPSGGGSAPLLSPKVKKRRPRRPKGFLGDTPMKMPKGQLRPGEVPPPVLSNVPWAMPPASDADHGHHDGAAHRDSHHGGSSHAPGFSATGAIHRSRAPLPPPPPPPPAPAPQPTEGGNGDNKSAAPSPRAGVTVAGHVSSHSRGASVRVGVEVGVPPILAASLSELDLPGHERVRTPSHSHGPGAPIPAAAHVAVGLDASGTPVNAPRRLSASEQMPPPHPRPRGASAVSAPGGGSGTGSNTPSRAGSRRPSGNAVLPPIVTTASPAVGGRVISSGPTPKSTAVTPRTGVSRAPSRRPSGANPDAAFYAAIVTKAHHAPTPSIAAEMKAQATTPRARNAPREGAMVYVGGSVLIRNSFGSYLIARPDGTLAVVPEQAAASVWKLEPVPESDYPNAVFIICTRTGLCISAHDDRQSVTLSSERGAWETFRIIAKIAFSDEDKEAERNRPAGSPPLFFLRSHHRTNLEQTKHTEDIDGGTFVSYILEQSQSEGSGDWNFPEEEFTFALVVPPVDEPVTTPAAIAASHSRGPSVAVAPVAASPSHGRAPSLIPPPITIAASPSTHSRAVSVAPSPSTGTSAHDRSKSRSPVELDGVRLSLTGLPQLPAPVPQPAGIVPETPRTEAKRIDREESDRVWDAYVAKEKERALAEEQKERDQAAAKLAAERAAAAGVLGMAIVPMGTPPTPFRTNASPFSPTATHRHTHTTVEAEVNRQRKEQAEKEAIEKQKRDSEAGALAEKLLAAQAEIEKKNREEVERQRQRDDKKRAKHERRERRRREKEERRVWELNEMSRRNRYLHRAPIDFNGSKMKNLCPLPRSLYSLNLDPLGDHPLVDDGVVFVLSRFSRGFRTTDLMDAFGNDVRPTIRWIDDYSAFAVVKEKDKADAAFEHVKRSELMTIQTLEQFQAQRAALIMEPLLRLATAPIGTGFSGDVGMDGYTNRSRARTLAKSPQYPVHFPGSPLGEKLRHISRTDGGYHEKGAIDGHHGDDVHIDIQPSHHTDVHPLVQYDENGEVKSKPFKIGICAMFFILLAVGIFAAGVGWTIGKSGRT